MNRIARALLIGTAAVMSIAATGNWLATVEQTQGGHRLGNPAAETRLIEFVSYTCPHCATFERQSEGALKLAYVQPGKLSVEIRHIIRDPVDLTVALLTNCGPKERFFQNHTLFMFTQDEWLGKAQTVGRVQQQRWYSGELPARFRAVASDLGLYDKMVSRGYTREEADVCLRDEAAARALVAQTEADSAKYGVTGTPSFAVDGKTLPNVHSWQALQDAIKPKP